jgi:uncharacterized membrane protein
MAVLLFWIVYSRFQAGGINAVDFTIYFDRPLFETSRGNWYFVTSTDDPRFENLTHLAVHAYWILLPLSLLYWIHATPMWLLALSVIAVVAGSLHTYRIVRQIGGGGLLALAGALAFLFNDNTARTLNYGFHAEVLYAWFIPWALDAGLRGARASFLAAVVASVLVKEDAIFPLFAVSMALALMRRCERRAADRIVFLGLPTALALLNLAVFYVIAVPRLAPSGAVMYASFWSSHGPTLWQAARSMLAEPGPLIAGALTSGFFSVVLARHFFLPLIGWRWMVGLVPMLVVYGASDNAQLRAFGIYYAIPLVPFLTVAGVQGARALTGLMWPGNQAEPIAALVVMLSALTVGLGYNLRPWKPELKEVRTAVERLGEKPVLVQSGLYPYAGYSTQVKLLAPHNLHEAKRTGAVVLLAPNASPYPFTRGEWECLADGDRLSGTPNGLRAVRLDPGSPDCAER